MSVLATMPRSASEAFKDVIGRFATGVTVITALDEGGPVGTTASAVTSVSADPPMLLVCMNKTSATGNVVRDSGRFAINVLAEDQGYLAKHFATKDTDKFASIEPEHGEHGLPLLPGALATLECRIVEEVTGGTHSVFLAHVLEAVGREGAPLAYFRGRFGRLNVEPA